MCAFIGSIIQENGQSRRSARKRLYESNYQNERTSKRLPRRCVSVAANKSRLMSDVEDLFSSEARDSGSNNGKEKLPSNSIVSTAKRLGSSKNGGQQSDEEINERYNRRNLSEAHSAAVSTRRYDSENENNSSGFENIKRNNRSIKARRFQHRTACDKIKSRVEFSERKSKRCMSEDRTSSESEIDSELDKCSDKFKQQNRQTPAASSSKSKAKIPIKATTKSHMECRRTGTGSRLNNVKPSRSLRSGCLADSGDPSDLETEKHSSCSNHNDATEEHTKKKRKTDVNRKGIYSGVNAFKFA